MCASALSLLQFQEVSGAGLSLVRLRWRGGGEGQHAAFVVSANDHRLPSVEAVIFAP